ncbi:MAG: hypothetical protein AAF624_17525, partial [Bacteroidota bacterium]
MLPIPEQLPLPTVATAFLDLAPDADGNRAVEVSQPDGENNLRRLGTAEGQQVDLVLASLATGSTAAPRIPLTFALDVDDSFAVQGGSFTV